MLLNRNDTNWRRRSKLLDRHEVSRPGGVVVWGGGHVGSDKGRGCRMRFSVVHWCNGGAGVCDRPLQ